MIDEMGDVRYGDCKKQAGLVVAARQADGGGGGAVRAGVAAAGGRLRAFV
jgi:hypothetical protein